MKKEEFNETLLYELYKEYPFDNTREIRGFIYKRHGVFPSKDLIARITNYQINKYGEIKQSGKSSFIKFIHKKHKSYLTRVRNNQRRKDLLTSRRIEAESDDRMRRSE